MTADRGMGPGHPGGEGALKTAPRPARLAAGARGGAWGALVGAGFGASLALAETLVGLVSGEGRPLDWWAILALYYVPALALLGGGIGLARSLVRPARDCGWADLWLLASAYLFFCTTVLLLQQCFPLQPLLAVGRAAATALCAGLAVLAWRLTRATGGPPARGGWPLLALGGLLIPTGLVASYALTLQAFDGRVGVGLSLLALPFAVFVLAARLLVRWPRARARFAILGLVVLLGGLVHATLPRGPGGPVSASESARPTPRGLPHGFPRPNIVLIVLDTLRAREVSCYGYPQQTTPHLDTFAREAVLYANVLASGNWSLPSHASLFTGLYPSRHGAHLPSDPEPDALPPPSLLAPEPHTLAEILSDQGYATALVSANFGVLSRFLGLQQGFRYTEARPAVRAGYRPLLLRVRERLPAWRVFGPALEWLATPYRPAEEITNSSRDWIRSGPRPGQPYFLCVNYMDAHEPHVPRGPFGERFAAASSPSHAPRHALSVADRRRVAMGQRRVSPEEARRLVEEYDAAVAYLDSHVGRLLDVLRARPDYANTWIFVTSDHGEALGEHQSLGHGQTLYQEILHVPLLVRYPDGWGPSPGTRDARPAQLVDIVPTVLQALGIAAPAPLDGVPLGGGREVMLAEDFPPSWPVSQSHRHGGGSRAIVVAGLKYLRNDDGTEELYDLGRDPLEERNLAETRPEAVAGLRARLEEWARVAAKAEPPPALREPLPPEVEEGLRALGYME